MAGAGGALPYAFARRVVPLLPSPLQRFREMPDWRSAVEASVGYASTHGASVVLPEDSSETNPQVGHLSDAREMQLIAAFGPTLAERSPGDVVRVVDFGGYLGDHRGTIARAYQSFIWDWTVVEIPQVVQACQASPRSGLRFTDSLSDALSAGPDVALASASLNYVESPLDVLSSLIHATRHQVITRLPLWPIPQNRVAVQNLSRSKHSLGYPTWFFSESVFLDFALSRSAPILRFHVPEDRAYFGGHYGTYQGMVLSKSSGSGASQ